MHLFILHHSSCMQQLGNIIAIGHPQYVPATYVYAMSLTDGSPLPNDLPCSAVNNFILDNILQSLIQTTTSAIIDHLYYYTCMASSLDQNYCYTTSKS